MDTLALIIRTIRESIEATGVPPDALQDAMASAERSLRSRLGGAMHPISRHPQVSTRARIIVLLEQGLSTPHIAERVGVDDSYVRRVRRWVRQAEGSPPADLDSSPTGTS